MLIATPVYVRTRIGRQANIDKYRFRRAFGTATPDATAAGWEAISNLAKGYYGLKIAREQRAIAEAEAAGQGGTPKWVVFALIGGAALLVLFSASVYTMAKT